MSAVPPHFPARAPAGAPLERIEVPPQEALRRGIIYTRVSRGVAWAMVVAFVALIYVVALVQVAAERRRGERPQVLALFDRSPTRENLKGWEGELERASLAKGFLQPRLQAWVTRFGGFGNVKAVVGRDGWLFYRPGVDYVAGPGILDEGRLARRAKAMRGDESDPNPDPRPDPRPAILQFHEQCRAAGAHLVVVPIPDKVVLQPGQLTRRLEPEGPTEPPNNVDFGRLVEELRGAGVDVFDPTPEQIAPGEVRFLVQDTHWAPEWMESVARDLARHVEPHLRGPPGRPLTVAEVEVSRLGDLVDMLKLPEGQTIYEPQRVTVRQVSDADGLAWRPAADAQVLLLGDSFTNIFSAAPMGWGESAGFAEQLSRFLRRPVDRIARNDNGAHATRQTLGDELARGRDRLAGKRVVIWQFAARELTAGDWKLIDMTAGQPRPAGDFVVPPAGESWVVTGTVEAVAGAPRPGSVPYDDHIVAAHLTELEREGGGLRAGAQALVFVWSMRDNVWTEAARWQPGQRVTLRLRPWAEVADELESVNRGELDDEAVQFEEPNWGEPVE